MVTQTLTQITTADATDVLELINADRLPGQPVCTREMLDQAISGSSPVDSGWWAELTDIRSEVLTGMDGRPAGVVAYARRQRDNAGVILWLHAREQRDLVRTLLERALAQLSGCSQIEAFSFATALGLGLEALPVRHRPVTHAELLERGFVGSNLWRYMHRELPADLPTTIHRLRRDESRTGRVLEVERDGQVVAEATVGDPVAGTGVLWWIAVNPDYQGRSLGTGLLGSALKVLADLGAREVILYVDDDAPDDDPERSRAAANAMYDRAGFTEIDRLWSYRFSAPKA